MVVVGPLQRVYQVKISVAWMRRSKVKVYRLMKNYLMIVTTLFASISAILYFFIPGLLGLLASTKLDIEDIETIQLLYAVLAAWIGIISMEYTFVAIGLASKNSRLFIAVNMLYIFTSD